MTSEKKPKKEKVKYPVDPYRRRIQLLQDFLSCRESTSESIKKMFKFEPTPGVGMIDLSDGRFYYKKSEIDQMLDYFQDASASCFCGKKQSLK